jgi:hypothetical protein
MSDSQAEGRGFESRLYAVTTDLSSRFKSRPGNCPCAPVAQGSGVLATRGRKFPIGKAAGRNASEPTGTA